MCPVWDWDLGGWGAWGPEGRAPDWGGPSQCVHFTDGKTDPAVLPAALSSQCPFSSVTVGTSIRFGGASVSVLVKTGITPQSSWGYFWWEAMGPKGAFRGLCEHLHRTPSPAPETPQGQMKPFTWHSRPCRSGPTYPPTALPTSAPSSLARHITGPDTPLGYLPLGLCSSCALCLGCPPLFTYYFHPGSTPFPKATCSRSPSRAGPPLPRMQHPQGMVTACLGSGPVCASISTHLHNRCLLSE